MIIDISKDEHTRRFFPKKHHIAPSEGFFHLNCSTVRERVFAARRATMFTGERVLLLQQLRNKHSGPTVDEGTVFIGDATLLYSFESAPPSPHALKYWQRELLGPYRNQSDAEAFTRLALAGAHPLPVYHGQIERAFMPTRLDIGSLIWEGDEATFIDLRSPRNARRFSLAHPELLSSPEASVQNTVGKNGFNPFGSDISDVHFHLVAGAGEIIRMVSGFGVIFSPQTSTKSLVDITTPTFLSHYKEQSLNPDTIFYQACDFVALSEEERSVRVFGRGLETRTQAMKRLRRLFLTYVVDQGIAEAPEFLIWQPLMRSSSFAARLKPDGALQSIPLPKELKKGRAAICRSLRLHLAIAEPDARNETGVAARLDYDWARQFAFEVKRPTDGHELFVLASNIDVGD